MRDAHEHPELGVQFRQFSRTVGRDGNTLYETISLAVADDGELLGLLDRAPADQRRPMLLLAAVHFLLLGGADHPLARRYRTVVELRGLPRSAIPDSIEGVGEEFRDFCAAFRPALIELVESGAVQTNEVGRCAGLLPGLSVVSRLAGRPLALLDLGASAGLNLLFDRYRYEYAGGEEADAGSPVQAGDLSSPVLLRCKLRGGRAPELATVDVVQRRGLDLRPVDPTDPDRALWLLACQWPDDLERFSRLRAALSVAAGVAPGDRPRVDLGDMVSDLPAAADAGPAPDEATLCVLHTWVAAYLTPDEQAAMTASMAELSHRRPVYWLYLESPFEVPGLPQAPAPSDRADRSASALMLVELYRGQTVVHRLADIHHHGKWIEWYGTGIER